MADQLQRVKSLTNGDEDGARTPVGDQVVELVHQVFTAPRAMHITEDNYISSSEAGWSERLVGAGRASSKKGQAHENKDGSERPPPTAAGRVDENKDDDQNVYLKRIEMLSKRTMATLDLGDSDMPDFMEHDKLYERNWRLILPLCVSCVILVIHNAVGSVFFSTKPIDIDGTEFWMSIIVTVFGMIFCLFFLGLGMYYKFLSSAKYIDASATEDKVAQKWSFNKGVINILRPFLRLMDKKFKSLEVYFFPKSERKIIVLSLFALLYASIDAFIVTFAKKEYKFDVDCTTALDIYSKMYSNGTVSTSNNSFDEYKDAASLCAIMRSSFGTTYAFVCCFAGVAFMSKPSQKCLQDILDRKNSLISSQQEISQKIQDKIKNVLTAWRDSHGNWKKLVKQQPVIWGVICFGIFGWHSVTGTQRLGEFWSFNLSSGVLCFVFYVVDTIIVIIMMQASVRIVAHFKFPSIIMQCFNLDYESIHKDIEDVGDLLSWWELRQFYIFILIHHFASDFHEYITCSIIGTIVSITIMLALWDCNGIQCITDVKLPQVMLVGTLYVVGFTIALTNDAVLYVKSQRKHLSMMNLVKLVSIERDIKNINGGNDDDGGVLDVIKSDIQDRLYLMKVLGVSIDENFLLGLRAGVVAFLGSLVFEMLT